MANDRYALAYKNIDELPLLGEAPASGDYVPVWDISTKTWVRVTRAEWVDSVEAENLDLAGTLDVTGAATFDSTVDVTGAATFTAAPDAPSYKADGITLGQLLWVDVAATAALLDSAGTVNVVAGVAGDQYKVRDIILVGGGTNFAGAGDRLIDLTDGTTVWTQIANADIESAPAASLKWGNAKVPLLTGTSNTASVAGQAIRFVYSGGTTDHSATGSITFSVCLEKVA